MDGNVDFMAQQGPQAPPSNTDLSAFNQNPFQGLDPLQSAIQGFQQAAVPPQPPAAATQGAAPQGPPAPQIPTAAQTAGPAMQAPEQAPGAYQVEGGVGPVRMSEDQAAQLVQQTEDASGDPTAKNYMFDPTHTASGLYQITDTNWKQYGPQAGVDTTKYPTAGSAPSQEQRKVFGAMYRAQGFAPWAPYNAKLAKMIGWKGATGEEGAAGAGAAGQLAAIGAGGQAALQQFQRRQEEVEAETERLTKEAVTQLESDSAMILADRKKQFQAKMEEANQLKSDDDRIMDWARQTPTRQAVYASAMHAMPLLAMLSALGGKATRASGLQMLGALNGVVEGVTQGAENKYNDAMTQWKNTYDAYMLHAKDMQAIFEKTAEAYGGRADAREKAADFTRRILDDRLNVQQLKLGDAAKSFDGQMKINEQLVHIYTALDKTQFNSTFPPNVIDYYARISFYDKNWAAGLARDNEGRQAIKEVLKRRVEMAQMAGITPGMMASIPAMEKGLTATFTDRQKAVARLDQYLAQFDGQMKVVEDTMKAGVAGGPPILNKWLNNFRSDVGDPTLTPFDNAIRGLTREHARIVTAASSNAALSVRASQVADELANRDMTPAQILAAMREMREEIQFAKSSGNDELVQIKELMQTGGGMLPQEISGVVSPGAAPPATAAVAGGGAAASAPTVSNW